MSEAMLLSKRIEGLSIIAREKVASFLSGNRRSLFLGHGTEFADLREYQTGDELRYIDWRASAKRFNTLIVRDFEVERNANVVLLVDASASMMLGRKEPRMKGAILSIASLAHAVIHNKDFFGFGAFSNSVSQFLHPRGGKSHEYYIYKQLLNLVPEGTTDIGEALIKVSTSLKRRSIIIVLTDLHDDTEGMIKGFRIARGFKHDVQVLQISDYGEYALPEKIGKIKFSHPDTNAPVVADFSDPIVSGIYSYEINKKLQEINNFKRKLRGLKIRVVETYSEDLTEKMLLAYFGSKQRGFST
ncbi:MAG: DUF58 domain-containing protein [Candidatus Kariarchaeaceae archaeon]|jgi:uncharacterized protein (DUF58 family)